MTHQVEAYPEESEGFLQGGTCIGQYAYLVFFSFYQRGKLLQKVLVAFPLVGGLSV